MQSTDRAPAGFRADIEGLRAVAILAVLLYHSEVPGFAGGFVGVDIFFVISGFLITGLLLRRKETGLGESLRVFYARRVRRLLPAALLVLVVTAVAVRLLLPAIEWQRTAGDIAASSLYLANFRFALQGSDYLDSALAPSPVLHYWSLSVEEQFYLVWPLLLLLLMVVAARRGSGPRRLVALGLGALTAASFLICLHLSASDPVWGFFAPWSRAWQFGVGGLIAVAAWGALSRGLRQLLAVAGIALIVFAVNQAGGQPGYPGWWALIPTAGAAALIVSGTQGRPQPSGTTSPTWVGGALSSRPATAVGRVSYSWYLWHWPPLAIITILVGEWPWQWRLVVVGLAAIPAVASYRWVETPLRQRDGLLRGLRRPAMVGSVLAAGTAAFGLIVLTAFATAPTLPAPMADTSPEPPAGAAAGAGADAGALRPAAGPGVTPLPREARADLPAIYRDGCHADIKTVAPADCSYAAGPGKAEATVVLLGDSHAAQWFPALLAAAEQRRWRLISLTKSGCPAAAISVINEVSDQPYAECDHYREATLDRVRQLRPDLVVVAEHRRAYSGVSGDGGRRTVANAEWEAALESTLNTIHDAGSRTAVIADTPTPGFDVPACLSRNPDSLRECTFDRGGSVSAELTHLPDTGTTRVHDFTDIICAAEQCDPVVSGWLVYRDADHLTASFARAMSDALGSSLDSQLAAELPG